MISIFTRTASPLPRFVHDACLYLAFGVTFFSGVLSQNHRRHGSMRPLGRVAGVSTAIDSTDDVLEPQAAWPNKLVLGAAPYLNRENVAHETEGLRRYISEKTGLPVEMRVTETYEEVVDLLVSHQLHVADLSPFNYVRAKHRDPDIEVLAAQVAEGGAAACMSYFVVRDDSPITRVEQLRGKRVAFVDPHSSTGYLYPLAYLRSLNIDPDTFFKSISFTGDHQTLVQMVMKGEVDAGASSSQHIATMPEARLRIIAKAGRVPFNTYVASSTLPWPLIITLRSALVELSTRTPEGRRVLNGRYHRNGFVAVQDSYYNDVRVLMKRAHID